MVATRPFAVLAREVAASLGMTALPLAVVTHPLGGIDAADVVQRADAVVESVLGLLMG